MTLIYGLSLYNLDFPIQILWYLICQHKILLNKIAVKKINSALIDYITEIKSCKEDRLIF